MDYGLLLLLLPFHLLLPPTPAPPPTPPFYPYRGPEFDSHVINCKEGGGKKARARKEVRKEGGRMGGMGERRGRERQRLYFDGVSACLPGPKVA